MDHENLSRLNPSLTKDSAYNMRMKEEQQQRQIQEKVNGINRMRKKAEDKEFHLVGLTDYIEELLYTCGSNKKAYFLEISRDFIRILTNIPMNSNLHPFLPNDDANNPRFHKVVAQILVTLPQIQGVRWMPHEDGTVLTVSVSL